MKKKISVLEGLRATRITYPVKESNGIFEFIKDPFIMKKIESVDKNHKNKLLNPKYSSTYYIYELLNKILDDKKSRDKFKKLISKVENLNKE